MKKFIVFLFLFSLFNVSHAAVEIKKFKTEEQEQQYKELINELRCVVCQNQNIADSNAGLATDLRNQVHKMILNGQSDNEIKEFMVTRYGDFVLYSPTFNASTFLLWVGPFIILIIGLFVLVQFIRQRRKIITTTLSNNDKEKLKYLLDENKE